MRTLSRALALFVSVLPSAAWGQTHCGGVERWAVKVAADPGASQIDDQNRITTSLHDLVHIQRPPIPADEVTRVAEERSVRVADGRLVKFKEETGKTGDSDYHLVISDATLLYTAGGTSSTVSPHSVIAEIPNPACVAGSQGTVVSPSRFAAELASVRTKFEQQFPTITSGWNSAGGVPVRLTGVVFFDRPHGQVGRALNGLELHPLLDIEFNPPGAAPAPPSTALRNPGFEDQAQGWTATADVITSNAEQPAHSGQWKAWLGGYGAPHTDRLSQDVTLPASAEVVSLSFYLHIETEEESTTAYDRMRVRVRDTSGNLLRTLGTFSNVDAGPGFALHALDLTEFRGRTIRISLEATEDSGSATSFVVDDVSITAEGP